ncbi:unnamed protein product [Candidula unifasciata]|uniref:Chitin-binding type-4 domain-containing protein n=1 Tax=Candidula unifasciata TaxID=100452 RepID=A0A8S3Z8R3_9EUPU|nr:unnamed protein product [Candidula unifasciata]
MLLASAVMGVLLTAATQVLGHGRLMDPPARNSMWRLGFPNPVNYNDNELYCGGRITQWARNKGKCGVCGDPHHHTTKDHEVGGKYANGIISRQYTQGDVIEVTVHITANHKGYFEFRICPVADPKVEVTQECLDQHVLEMVNGEGTRYHLPEGKSNQFFNVSLQLPADVTCKQCVIQWKYRTGV